jgi:copper transport protein
VIAQLRVATAQMSRLRPKSSTLVSLLGCWALLLLLPASAAAHAHLVSSSPSDGETVQTSPTKLVLQFSGNVEVVKGSIQVFSPNGGTVQDGEPKVSGNRIVQRLTDGGHGTYGVSYRVSSEDGHVVTGTTTFVLVKSSHGGHAARGESEAAAAVDSTLQVLFSTARFIEVLALLAAAGGGIFACLIAPTWRPRLLVPAVVVLLFAYAAGFVINAAIIRGTGLGDAFSADAVRATAQTPFGRSLELRAIIAVVAFAPAVLLTMGPRVGTASRLALSLVFMALAASLSITGHAVTTEPTLLRMPLDMLHVIAAAVWLGGLVQLGYLAPFARTRVDDVVRFSRTAFTSVMLLLLSGLYAVYAELGLHPHELVDSRYGRLVLAKFILYLGTMPLAWNNMSAFVPNVRRRPDDAPRMLRQYVWREFALLVAVLALTVWLIATPQPH